MNFQSLCSGRDTLAVQRGEITYEMLIAPRPKRRRKACLAGSFTEWRPAVPQLSRRRSRSRRAEDSSRFSLTESAGCDVSAVVAAPELGR